MKIKEVFDLILPEHIFIPITGTIVGATLSINKLLNLYDIILPALSFCFLVFGFNSINAIFDRNADKINKPKRPIPSGTIRLKEALYLSIIFDAIGLIIAMFVNTKFLILALLFVILGVIYSAPPLRIKDKTLGINLMGGVMYGLIPILAGSSLVNNAILDLGVIIYFFVITFLLSTIKDFDDNVGDYICNTKSLPVILGNKGAKEFMFSSVFFVTILFMIYAYLNNLSNIIYSTFISLLLVSTLFIISKREKLEDTETKNIIHQSNKTRLMLCFALLMELSYIIPYII